MDEPTAPMAPARPLAPGAPVNCRHCSAPLEPLLALRGLSCRRSGCLRKEDERRARAERERVERELPRRLAPRLGRRRAESVLTTWIEAFRPEVVALPADRIAAHREWLEQEAAAPEGPAADPAAEAPPRRAAERQLCAWCGGRCCRMGATTHGFIVAAHLRRWVAEHAGSTPADAVAAYLERLPAQHVDGSCVYHGAAGCTLDRSMRSDTCNRYVCNGLAHLHAGAAQRPDADWVFVAEQHGQVQSLALAAASDARSLPEPLEPLEPPDPLEPKA